MLKTIPTDTLWKEDLEGDPKENCSQEDKTIKELPIYEDNLDNACCRGGGGGWMQI